jgi:ribosomal protein L34
VKEKGNCNGRRQKMKQKNGDKVLKRTKEKKR